MAGPPEIQFTLSSGEVEAVPPGPLATETIDIEPGTAAILVFGSTSVCPSSDPPVTATSATITLGGDPVTLTQSMDLGCGAPAVGYFAANGTGGVPPSDAVSGVISPAS